MHYKWMAIPDVDDGNVLGVDLFDDTTDVREHGERNRGQSFFFGHDERPYLDEP